MTPAQWEFAFVRVLFPMLRKLLEMGGSTGKPDQGREETRLRVAMMLSKVFLHHCGPFSSLPTFTALWLTILDLVRQFCAIASTDMLADALTDMCVRYANDYQDHASYNKFVVSAMERKMFNLSGDEMIDESRTLYRFKLESMKDEQLHQASQLEE